VNHFIAEPRMTASSLLGDLYVVGTDHNVGTWDGVGVHNLGDLGGWKIQQLTFDSDGAMWCVGTEYNVGKWNGQGWDDKGKMGGWSIQQILFDREGTLWCVGTDHNVGKWNGHGWEDKGQMGGWWIQQILFDADGVMWCVGTDHNVGTWNGHGWEDKGYMGGWWIQQLLFDADGTMWCVGTEHNVGKWNGSGWDDLRSTFKWDVVWITWRPQETASAFENWTVPVPVSASAPASCLAYGMVWRSAGGTLYGFDHFTGKQTYAINKFGADQTVRSVQPYDGGLLVYASDGYLYKANLTTDAKPTKVAYVEAEPFWMMAYRGSVYLASRDGGLQRVPPSSEDFQPSSNDWITLPYEAGAIAGAPSIGSGYLLIPMRYSQVNVINAVTFNGLWSAKVPWADGYLSYLAEMRTSFNGEYFCVASGDREVSAVSVTRQKIAWTKSFAADIGAQPICDSKYCCVSLKSGQLLVLSIIDGSIIKTISLPGIYDRLVMEEGILYGALDPHGYSGSLPIGVANSVFALDVATGAVAVARTGSAATVIATENGVFYYHSDDAVTASRLGQLLRTFYAEATLLQDFDFSSGASGSPKKPLINTEITIFNNDGTPQPAQHVRVGATAPATIESRGETYSVGPLAYASIPTGADGRLRIAIRAGNSNDQNQFRDGLTSPALTLFTTFMGANQRILIRPDAQLHDKLAGMKDDALATAVDYEQKPILRDKYQDKQKAVGSATQMVKATLSMVKTSVDQRNRRRATRDDYLAPGCDTEVICCCHDKDYAVPVICTRNFAFDLDQSTFKGDLDERQTQEWLEAHQATGPVKRGWDDYFWEAIKNGTAAITRAIIYAKKEAANAVKALVTAVINGARQTFELLLETIEQAANVVHGIFNEIVDSIGKVLQAFSFAFSWPAIVDLKNQIKVKTNTSWDAVLKPASPGQPSQYDRAATAALTAIDTFRDTADQAFEQIKGRFGGKSVAEERKQAIGDKNPAAGGSTDNWLQAKLSDNLLSERALPRPGGQTRAAAIPDIPHFDMPDGVIEDLQGLIPRLGKVVTPDEEAHLRRIGDDLAPGSGLDVFTAAVSAIIEIIHGAVDIAIKLAKEALETLLRIIKSVLMAAREFVEKEIKIPFISELYEHVVGGPLTILDLSALLIAVPLSLVIAATTLNDRHAELTPRVLAGLSPRGTEQIVVGAAAGVGQILWAFFSTSFEFFNLYVEERKEAPPLLLQLLQGISVFLLAFLLIVVRGLSLASEILEARSPENREDGQPDWIRVLKLWGPSMLTAAVDFVTAVVKAWVINHENPEKYKGLQASMVYISVGGGAFFALVDAVTASVTIKFEGADDYLEFISHLSEDVALWVRVASLWIRKAPGTVQWQIGLLAATLVLLTASGLFKVGGSLAKIGERSAMA
jgi:hypothetical protein